MAFTEVINYRNENSTYLAESFNVPLRDHCERATQLFRNLEEGMKWTQKSVKSMDVVLDDVYTGLQPSEADRMNREYDIQFLDSTLRRKIPGSRIVAFGSYVMDMFTSKSDLDLSLTLGSEDCSRDDKLRYLKRLRKSLYQLENDQRSVSKIQAVMRATVPVVKFTVSKTGTECDISVENRDGVLKSTLLRIFSSIDIRFKKLCYLLKHWAKAQGVNNPKEGTLSSFAIILLVAFHLQTRSPPIFPPFSVIFSGLDLKATPSIFSEVQRRVERFKAQRSGRVNTESLSQLLATFFAKLVAVEDLWQEGLCASTFEGRWISKLWSNNKFGIISVEDLTNRAQNSARAVSRKEFDSVYQCLKSSLAAIQRTLMGKADSDELISVLFMSHVKKGKRRLKEPILFSKEKQLKLDPTVSRFLQKSANVDVGRELDGHMPREVGHVSVIRQEQLQYQQPPVSYITNGLQRIPFPGQVGHVPQYVALQHPALMPTGMEHLIERPYVTKSLPILERPYLNAPVRQMGFPSSGYLPSKSFVPEHVGYDPNMHAYSYNYRDLSQIQVQPWIDHEVQMVRRRF